MVRLGTIAAIGFGEFDPAEWLSLWRRLGCTVVQAYRNPQAGLSADRIAEAIAGGGMPCDSLHGLYGDEYDPSNPEEPLRLKAVDAFRREGELCRRLGGRCVVVHCSTIRREGVPPEERRRRASQLRKSIAELGAFGKEIGQTYAFENLPGYHPVGSDVAELAAILSEVSAPATGMCFDSAHANMAGDPTLAVLAAAGRIVYTHINDNDGATDSHDLPFFGTIDWPMLCGNLHRVGYEGTLMLECFYSPTRLRQLIDEGYADRLAGLLAIAGGTAGEATA